MAKYVSNENLLKEIVESKKIGELTPMAIVYIKKMIKEIGTELRYKINEDKEDCAGEAMYCVIKYWQTFDENITTNAFSYFTQIIKNGYGIGYNKLHPKNMKTVPISIGEKKNNKSINNI